MKLVIAILQVCCAFSIANTARAFETPTHFAISLSAATTALNDQTLRRIGRLPEKFGQNMQTSAENDIHTDFIAVDPHCYHRSMYTSSQLIACGAMFEDFYQYPRPTNHFLDPQHTDSKGKGSPLLGSFSAASWALQDDPDDSGLKPLEEAEEAQHYSYKDAERYLWNALSYRLGADAVENSRVREQNWGLMFQSLGQIIHLLQDMASPQHTRNEMHHDKIEIGRITQISRYEQRALIGTVDLWIKKCLIVSAPKDCEYNPPIPIVPVYPAFAEKFQTPRSFWESSTQTGLAQVTSRSFPSNLRNFVEDGKDHYASAPGYPYPVPAGYKDVPLSELTYKIPDGVPPFVKTACNGDLASCKMRMIAAAISDPLSPDAPRNDRASSESLFDQDLKSFNRGFSVVDSLTGIDYVVQTRSRLAINRFNIDRAYSLLIPRAVSYSAGLLNFYFRGEMSIKPPVSGVYSIVDGSDFSLSKPTDVTKGYRGFKTLRLSLANTTPSPYGAPPQKMTDGTLWAILRFQRNNCYTDDLEGQGTNAAPLEDCLSSVEEIAVSDPIDRTGKGKEAIPQPTANKPDGEEVEFNFQSELPINAWNILLQVVFRGTLGTETNKIAVSTIDISEPTFFTVFNNTDYVYLGGNCYKPQQVVADKALWTRVGVSCRQGNDLDSFCVNATYGVHLQQAGSDPPRYTIVNESTSDGDTRIPPKRFSRFAVLAASDGGIDLTFHLLNPLHDTDPKPIPIHIDPYHAHKSRATPRESTRDYFTRYRGIPAWHGVAFMMDVETMNVAQSDNTDCIGGADNLLSQLTGENRYPVPSKIKFAKP